MQQYPRDLCAHHVFEAQVERKPNAIAVSFLDQKLTYSQLNACANRLADHLVSLGAGSEVLVAICLERSLDLIVAMLAVMKLGSATCPSIHRIQRNVGTPFYTTVEQRS